MGNRRTRGRGAVEESGLSVTALVLVAIWVIADLLLGVGTMVDGVDGNAGLETIAIVAFMVWGLTTVVLIAALVVGSVALLWRPHRGVAHVVLYAAALIGGVVLSFALTSWGFGSDSVTTSTSLQVTSGAAICVIAGLVMYASVRLLGAGSSV